MAYLTLSSGLTLQVPTRGTRSWADTFLADFARKISAHDHTGSGKGTQIVGSAIASAAITAVKCGFAFSDWSPDFSGNDSLTWPATANFAKYLKLGRLVIGFIDAIGTTGGTPSNGLQFSLPVTAAVKERIHGVGRLNINGTLQMSLVVGPSTSLAGVVKPDFTNYTGGVSHEILECFIYESAS